MNIDDNIKFIREDFPLLKKKVYLNCAAAGPPLKKVSEVMLNLWKQRLKGKTLDRTPDTKGEVAKLISADPDEICWVSRVTQGINIVASMTKAGKGDNIVVTDLAYPSNTYPWFPFMEKGVEIRRIEHKNCIITTADFEKAVDDNTKVVSISSVEWTTGLRYDMKAISHIAHEHGAIVLDDAYQSVGPTKVDVHSNGVDFLVSGSGKWLCAPITASIFYARREIIEDYEPAYRFYSNIQTKPGRGLGFGEKDHNNMKDYMKPVKNTAERFNRGTVTGDEVIGLHASVEYFNQLGPEKIEERNLKLSKYLMEGLKNLGVIINTPWEPKMRGGSITYHTGSYELNKKSYEAITKNNITLSHRYSGGAGGIRVSPHFFNTEADIDRLLKEQKKLL